METSSKNGLGLSSRLTTGFNRQEKPVPFGQSVPSEPNCPCCSDALLRPIRLDEIYWRCSCRYRDTSI
jgi:hypothetical protein